MRLSFGGPRVIAKRRRTALYPKLVLSAHSAHTHVEARRPSMISMVLRVDFVGLFVVLLVCVVCGTSTRGKEFCTHISASSKWCRRYYVGNVSEIRED